jgi:transposase
MDTPFVCNINALSETQRKRYREITENLHDSRQSVKELNDGYAFRFKAESQMILEAAEFIVYERLCCPFFNFELAVEQDTNRLWLRLRGQEGIKEFIRFEFKIIED